MLLWIALLVINVSVSKLQNTGEWLLMLILLWLPFIVMASLRKRPASWSLLISAVWVWLLTDTVTVLLSSVGFLNAWQQELALQWNWIGKIGALSACVLYVMWSPDLTWRSIGVCKSDRSGIKISLSLVALMVTAVIVMPSFAELWINVVDEGSIRVETLLYQLLIPTLTEEIQYRGIIQSLLRRCYVPSVTLGGARVGWECVLTAVLFALAHGVSMNGVDVSVDYTLIVMMFPEALFLSWLRERSGSLAPGMIYHSAANASDLIYKWLRFGVL